MASTQQLIGQLESIAKLDKELWVAYRESLKEAVPPVFNFVKAIRKTKQMGGSVRWYWWCFAGCIVLSSFCAWLAISWSPLMFFGYIAMLAAAVHFYSKYIESFSVVKIGRPEISKHSFGLDTPSLLVAGVMDSISSRKIKVDKTKLENVIKLNKAAQEFQDVSFGIEDALRKAAIAAPYAFGAWLFTTNYPVVDFVKNAAVALFAKPDLLFAAFIIFTGLLLVSYQIIFSSVVTKKSRKRYLLVLNLMRENFQ